MLSRFSARGQLLPSEEVANDTCPEPRGSIWVPLQPRPHQHTWDCGSHLQSNSNSLPLPGWIQRLPPVLSWKVLKHHLGVLRASQCVSSVGTRCLDLREDRSSGTVWWGYRKSRDFWPRGTQDTPGTHSESLQLNMWHCANMKHSKGYCAGSTCRWRVIVLSL